MKKMLLAVHFSAVLALANYFGSPDMAGNPQSLMGWGSPASGTSTIAPSQFRPGQGPGKLIGPVNGFDGQPHYSVALGGLNARGVVSFPLVLSYSGPTKPLMEADHNRGNVGWIGLGWNHSTPFIAINHKGTYTYTDDVIFANLGPFGGGQILQSASGAFQLSTNPYINISTAWGAGEFSGQIIRWTFTLPDGKRLNFGESDNSRRMVFYNHNVVKAVPFAGISTKRFIYRWDVSTLNDFTAANSIQFDYEKFGEAAEQGRTYDREAYVKNIRWNGPGGAEAERYEFLTAAKQANEFLSYSTGESRDDQRIFETRFLDRINCFKEGVLTHHYKLNHHLELGGSAECFKRLLDNVKVFRYENGQNAIEDRGWTFTYNAGNQHYSLWYAKDPSGTTQTFTYKLVNFTGKDGDQSTAVEYMKREDNVTHLALTTDNAKLALWQNETKCDEQYCYVLIKDGRETAPVKLYAEIRPNRGNYFDTSSSNSVWRLTSTSTNSKASELDLIPGGGHLLWVNYKDGTLDLYEWDDGKLVKRSPFAGDPRYSTGSFRHRIKVYPGGDYFVVHKTNVLTGSGSVTPDEIIVVKRLPGGEWKSLNRDGANCQFHNRDWYGENIRASTTGGACMEFNHNVIEVSISQSFFTVLHKDRDVITLFGSTTDGNGFSNQTNLLPVVPGATQKAGFPMNWDVELAGVTAARDYFVINANNNTQALYTCYYGGDKVLYSGGQNGFTTGVRNLWASDTYFLEMDPKRDFWFWEKRIVSGSVSFVRSASALSLARPSAPESKFPLVRVHPKAFAIEFYESPDSVGARPSLAGTNYASNLFHVDKAHSGGFSNRTSNLQYNGETLFNVTFSGSDDYLFALSGQTSAGGACANGQGCNYRHVSVRAHPNNSNQYVFPAEISLLTLSTSAVLKQFQTVVSGARIAMRTSLDVTPRKVRLESFQWGGSDYLTPKNHYVIDKVSVSAELGSEAKDNVVSQYVYDRNSLWKIEFNSNLQSPQFEYCEVKQVNSLGATLGGSLTAFHLDALSKPYGDTTIFLVGNEHFSATFGANGDTLARTDQQLLPYRANSWPSDLFVNRLYKSFAKEISSNRAYRISTMSYHRYNDSNGVPRYTVSALGSGPHGIGQTLFDAQAFPSQSIRFMASTYPDTNLLRTVDSTRILNTQTGFTSLTPVSSTKSTTNSNFLPVKQEVWRDFDDGMSEAGMKTGANPVFNLSEGWIPTGEITKRNGYNQTTESKAVKSGVSGDETFNSQFYEGRMSLPVATVSNSKLDNCAVLLGENVNAGIAGIDYPARWESHGTTLHANLSHTGRGSLRVIDHFGPTINLHLKDVRSKGFGIRVSAWIYADNGTTPIMTVERRSASGTVMGSFSGAPVGYGYYLQQNRWQRWEVNLSHQDLIKDNLFNGANDYLRIWIGTGSPASSSRLIYVDDIVILPSNASFSTATFDYRGIPLSNIGGDHRPAFFDIDVRGGVMGVRDDRKRIFSQQGFHYMGEN